MNDGLLEALHLALFNLQSSYGYRVTRKLNRRPEAWENTYMGQAEAGLREAIIQLSIDGVPPPPPDYGAITDPSEPVPPPEGGSDGR